MVLRKQITDMVFVFDSIKQIRNLMLTAIDKYFSKIENEGYKFKKLKRLI
jgi:hypothetical protein